MIGSAWADLSRTALVSDENSFVATGKDLPLLVVVFANLQEAIAVIWRDVCTTLLYLLKSRLFYLCFTLLMLIAAPKPEAIAVLERCLYYIILSFIIVIVK